jgi:prevent-host-death family protein
MNIQSRSDTGKSKTRTVSAAEANRQFSALLRAVQEGETITITSRGVSVAVLQPFDANAAEAEAEARQRAWNAYLADLQSRPLLHLGKFNREDCYE